MSLAIHHPTLPTVLRQSADRYPDRDFILSPGRRLTFGDAESQSRRLAKRLLRSGVGKSTRVGLLFPQGPDFVLAFLAITRIGAVAVPLSTFLSGPELRTAVRHADVNTLVAPRLLLDRDTTKLFEDCWPELLTAPGSTLFLTEAPYLRHIWVCDSGADGADGAGWVTTTPDLVDVGDDPDIADALVESIESEVRPSDHMVMIFTSGATAEPKAVVHTHGAQIRHSRALAQLYGFTADVRTFTTMPFFWVGGLTVSVLSHLHVGGAVITIETLDGPRVVDLIEETSPSRVVGWGLIERLEADPALLGRDLADVKALRPPSMARPNLRHNSLGMTETSGPHTMAVASQNDIDLPDHLRGSFGPPVPGIEHKIIDPETGSVAIDGNEGEICVRGYSLMDSLYKRERAETFDGDGWYHTGDKGFFHAGLLFFTGRATEMIKTSGANVSPREVELAVESIAGVRAAFVLGLPDPDRGETVGCLICPHPGELIDVAAVREHLERQLSSYKVPRRITVVEYDDLPWLPSGKISKPRLHDLFA